MRKQIGWLLVAATSALGLPASADPVLLDCTEETSTYIRTNPKSGKGIAEILKPELKLGLLLPGSDGKQKDALALGTVGSARLKFQSMGEGGEIRWVEVTGKGTRVQYVLYAPHPTTKASPLVTTKTYRCPNRGPVVYTTLYSCKPKYRRPPTKP